MIKEFSIRESNVKFFKQLQENTPNSLKWDDFLKDIGLKLNGPLEDYPINWNDLTEQDLISAMSLSLYYDVITELFSAGIYHLESTEFLTVKSRSLCLLI